MIADTAMAFDAAFHRRAPHLVASAQAPDDYAFLVELFCQCSPLATILPPVMLQHQAETQIASHHAAHPNAMFRVIRSGRVADGRRPIGRIIVDWDAAGVSHGVDIAVLPSERTGLAGLHMLRAWLDVCDQMRLSAKLEVLANNPARLIYQWLGFISEGASDTDSPSITMGRQTRGIPPTQEIG